MGAASLLRKPRIALGGDLGCTGLQDDGVVVDTSDLFYEPGCVAVHPGRGGSRDDLLFTVDVRGGTNFLGWLPHDVSA